MREHHSVSGPWHPIERRGSDGRVLDYVEVGACARCGRGVDREVRAEYRTVGGELVCAGCAPRHAVHGVMEPKDGGV